MSDAGMGGPGTAELSVVVVNHNSGDGLSNCLRSVFDSAGDVRLEVLVVDNASNDGSLQAAMRSHPDVHVIRNAENRGFTAAANQGMRAGHGAFFLLLNPDAEIASGTLEGLLKVARDHPRAGAIGPVVRDPDGSIYPSARRLPTLWGGLAHTVLGFVWPENPWSRRYRMAEWDRRSEREVDWVSGSSMLLRRAALDQVGMFDEAFFMYAEDMDQCTRLRGAGWEVWFSPQLEVVHVGGTASAGKRSMTFEHSRSIYRYFSKHHAASGWRVVLRPPARLALGFRARLVSWLRHER